MKIGPCVKENLGFLGCNRDVTSLMASKCSGRQSCEVSVQDQALHDSNPCSRDATYSLEVTYKCMSGRLQVHDKHSLYFLDNQDICSTLSVEAGTGFVFTGYSQNTSSCRKAKGNDIIALFEQYNCNTSRK